MANTTAPEGSIDAVTEMLVETSQAEETVDEAEQTEASAPDEDQPEVEAVEAEEDGEEVEVAENEGDDDEDDEPEEQDDGENEPELITVKVDGKETQVTIDDLKRSYSGQAYIQKGMAEAAKVKKEAEQVYQALNEERQALSAAYQQLQTQGAPQMPDKPSKELLNSDPIGYFEQMEAYREASEQFSQYQQQYQAFTQQQSEAQKRAEQAYLAEQAELLKQSLPEFADAEKAGKLKERLVNTAVNEYGYSPEEMAQVKDARAVRILADAMKYRELQGSKDKVAEKSKSARPVVKPGVKRSDNDGKLAKQRKAAARMKKNGSVDDVANFLLS